MSDSPKFNAQAAISIYKKILAHKDSNTNFNLEVTPDEIDILIKLIPSAPIIKKDI